MFLEAGEAKRQVLVRPMSLIFRSSLPTTNHLLGAIGLQAPSLAAIEVEVQESAF